MFNLVMQDIVILQQQGGDRCPRSRPGCWMVVDLLFHKGQRGARLDHPRAINTIGAELSLPGPDGAKTLIEDCAEHLGIGWTVFRAGVQDVLYDGLLPGPPTYADIPESAILERGGGTLPVLPADLVQLGCSLITKAQALQR